MFHYRWNKLTLFYLFSCEQASYECSNEFCNNKGTCVLDQSTEMGFKCNCRTGYTGTTCLTNLNPCSSSPCRPDHTCINSASGGYLCICIQGVSCPISFSSLLSSIAPINKYKNLNYLTVSTSPCSVNTCRNDGICEIKGLDDFICNCKFGYVGNYKKKN